MDCTLSEHGKKEAKRKRAAKWSPDDTIILLQSLRDLVQKSQAGEQCAKGSDKWEHISKELSRTGCAPREAKSVAERWDTLRQAYLRVEEHLRAGKDFPQALRESRKEFKFLPAEYTHEWHALAAGCGPTHKKKHGAELASVKNTPAKQNPIDATPCKVTPASVSLETFAQAFLKHIKSVESLQSRSRDPASASQRCDETDEAGDIVTSLLSIVEAVETRANCEKSELNYSLEIDKREWKLVQDRASSLLEDHRRRSRSTPRDVISDLEQALECFQGLVYPQNDSDAVTLTQQDVRTLNPSEFLNDTIIDFYNKYLLQNLLPRERFHTLHVFNSFFFPKLAGTDISYKVQSRAAFERVKKWTMKIQIFEKDYIFIPVNQRSHWSLIIICHPGRICDVDGTSVVSDVGDPCILHLDSYEGYHTGLEDTIKNYLSEEWKERNPDANARGYFDETHFISAKVPQQDNNYDCGIFLLHYLELFLKVAPPTFNLKCIRNKDPCFLRRDWFKPSEALAKRPFIQELIISISQGASAASMKNAQEPSNFEANGGLAGVSEPLDGRCDHEKLVSLECEHDTHKSGTDLVAAGSQLLGLQMRGRANSKKKKILPDMQAAVTRPLMLVASGRKTPPSDTLHGEVGPSLLQTMASTSGHHDTSIQNPCLLIKDSKNCQTTRIECPNGVHDGDEFYYIHQGDSLLLCIEELKGWTTFYMHKNYTHGTPTLRSSWQILFKGLNTRYGCRDCKDGEDGMRIVEATSKLIEIHDVLNSKVKLENLKFWSPPQNIEDNIEDRITRVLLHPNLNIGFWVTKYGVLGAYDLQDEKLIGRVHLPQQFCGVEQHNLVFSITLNMLVVSTTFYVQVFSIRKIFTWALDDEQVERLFDFDGHVICDLHNDQVRLLICDKSNLAIYDLQQRQQLQKWTPNDKNVIFRAKYSCDSQLVYAVFNDESIGIFDATCLQLHCRITPNAYADPSYNPALSSLRLHFSIPQIAVHPRKRNQFAILSLFGGCIYVIEPSDELRGEWVCKANQGVDKQIQGFSGVLFEDAN